MGFWKLLDWGNRIVPGAIFLGFMFHEDRSSFVQDLSLCFSLSGCWFMFFNNLYVYVSCSLMSDSLWFLCPWNSPGQNTGVGCQSLLQGIFPSRDWTNVSHRQILYQLSYEGSKEANLKRVIKCSLLWPNLNKPGAKAPWRRRFAGSRSPCCFLLSSPPGWRGRYAKPLLSLEGQGQLEVTSFCTDIAFQ